MSTPFATNSVSQPNIGTLLAADDEEKPPRSGEGRVRLPNKTQWALRAMLDAAQKGRALMEEIRKWIKREELDAKGRYDSARLERLGELNGYVADLALHVGELERLASDARVGLYEPRLAAGKEGGDAKQ